MIGRGTWIRTKETSRSQSERSTRLSYTPKIVGPGGRNRTASGDFGDRNVTVTPHRNNIEGFCVTEIPQNDPATLFTTDLDQLVQQVCLLLIWCRRRYSKPQPSTYKDAALPVELLRQ